jgi:hypothetical protein
MPTRNPSDVRHEQLIERLDLILRVLAMQVGTDKSMTERAYLLKTAGMDNDTIAQVLNTTNQTIRTLVSTRARAPKKRNR